MTRPRFHSRLATLLMTLVSVLVVSAAASAAGAQAAVPGFQVHLLWDDVDSAKMDQQLDLAKGANASLVRVDVGWSALEGKGKGQWDAYHLGRLDKVVNKAEARGLKVLLTLWSTPCWASSAPATVKQGCKGSWWGRGVVKYAPADPQDYADALGHLVARYGTRVAGWELWNEPNSDDFWVSPSPVADYVALVKASYKAAKAADPRVPVVAGALMHADFKWTERLYQHGIKGHFDAFSIHPYSEDKSPLVSNPDYMNVSFVDGVPAVRDAMLRHGDDKPMWLTELGWSTANIRGPKAWLNGVDETDQARYVAQALERVTQWSYVDAIIFYNLVDKGTDRGDLQHNYGLVRRNGTPKPALASFRTTVAGLTGAPAAGPAAPAQPAPVLELSSPESTQAPVTSAAPAGPDEGGSSSTTLSGGEVPRLVVARRPTAKVRAKGTAPGARRVTIKVRRISGRRAVRRVALKARAAVSATDRRFSRSFKVGKLARGTYSVTVSGATGRAGVLLTVR